MALAVASREQYAKWVIEALGALGRSGTPNQVYNWVSSNCPVPSQDELNKTPDGKDFVFCKELRFARWQLARSGVIDGSKRGVWTLK